jgi:hypothetical protein
MLSERLAEDKEALKLQREADNQRIIDLERLLRTEIRAVKELGEQHHAAQQRALEVSSDEREKSAEQLRKQLVERMDALSAALRQQIEHQAEQRRFQLDAHKEAISKADQAVERRFEVINGFEERLRNLLPREIFDAAFADYQSWREQINSRLDLQSGLSGDLEAIVARHEKTEEETQRRFTVLEKSATTVRTQMLMVGAFATVMVSIVVIIVNLFFAAA